MCASTVWRHSGRPLAPTNLGKDEEAIDRRLTDAPTNGGYVDAKDTEAAAGATSRPFPRL